VSYWSGPIFSRFLSCGSPMQLGQMVSTSLHTRSRLAKKPAWTVKSGGSHRPQTQPLAPQAGRRAEAARSAVDFALAFDTPSRLAQLQFLRRYLLGELERVERRIAAEEQREAAARRTPPPPPDWILSYLRTGSTTCPDAVHVGAAAWPGNEPRRSSATRRSERSASRTCHPASTAAPTASSACWSRPQLCLSYRACPHRRPSTVAASRPGGAAVDESANGTVLTGVAQRPGTESPCADGVDVHRCQDRVAAAVVDGAGHRTETVL
jgi:hypothetical protein